MDKYVFLSITLLLSLLLPWSVSAGTISISTSVSTQMIGNYISGTVEVSNGGDSTAHNVYPSILYEGVKFDLDSIDLAPGNNKKWNYSHEINFRAPGSYPILIDVKYQDANRYQFSSTTLTTVIFKQKTISSINLQTQSLEISESGEIEVKITNLDDSSPKKPKNINVWVVIPSNLRAQKTFENIDITDSTKINFPIDRGTALDGSNYNVYIVAEYDEDGMHYSDNVLVPVKIIQKKDLGNNNTLYLILAGLALILFLLDIRLKKKENQKLSLLFEIVILILIIVFIFTFIKPSLVFSDTTITGGDTGSHVVLADYLKNYLLPHGKLIGWYPNWMAGLPMLQFYFIPPYLMVALLSYLIPFNIAFKFITILGILLFPIATYLSLKYFKFKSPIPISGAIITLFLLFDETFSIWGGNIKSTFAGQFPHMISFALLVLGMGLIYNLYFERKGHVLTILILSLVMTTHIYTTVILVLSTSFYFFYTLFSKKNWKGLYSLFLVFLSSSLISSYWLFPMFMKLRWTSPPSDILYGFPMFEKIFTSFYLWIIPIAIFGIIMLRKKIQIRYLLYSYIVVLLMTIFSGYTNFLYIRFISYLYFVTLVFVAIGVSYFFINVKRKKIFAFLFLFLVFFAVSSSQQDIVSWTKWNYEGIEGKSSYPLFKQIMEKINDYDEGGRVNIEYANYNYLGTPRIFEASPIFTQKPVIEALLVESSLTFPYHYYIQKEITKDAWWPTFPIRIPSVNVTQAADDMWFYNVKYFVSSNQGTQKLLQQSDRYIFDEKIDNFAFYYLNEDSDYVEPLVNTPVLIITDDFRPFAYEWFAQPNKDTLIVFSDKLGDYEIENFDIIVLNKSVKLDRVENANDHQFYSSLDDALEVSKSYQDDCKVESDIENEKISFSTTCPYRPHVVKVSYFPNWVTDQKIYLAAPSIMLTIPSGKNNVIEYKNLWIDNVAIILVVLGFILLFSTTRLSSLITEKKFEKIFNEFKRMFRKLFRSVKRYYKIILLIVIALLLVNYFLNLNTQKNKCVNYCLDNDFQYLKGTLNTKVIDSFDLGFSHKIDNKKHNFICSVNFCEKTRKDFVYVHNGNISFDMKLKQDYKNFLNLGVTGKSSCRTNDIFVDNEYLTTISTDVGKSADFRIEIPQRYNDGKINVLITHSSDESCYGFDVYEASIEYDLCRCQ